MPWSVNPDKGQKFAEGRRAEIVACLEQAADVAFYALDQELNDKVERLNKEYGDKKANIVKAVEKARSSNPMESIRKYWNMDKDLMWKNFIHNMIDGTGNP